MGVSIVPRRDQSINLFSSKLKVKWKTWGNMNYSGPHTVFEAHLSSTFCICHWFSMARFSCSGANYRKQHQSHIWEVSYRVKNWPHLPTASELRKFTNDDYFSSAIKLSCFVLHICEKQWRCVTIIPQLRDLKYIYKSLFIIILLIIHIFVQV